MYSQIISDQAIEHRFRSLGREPIRHSRDQVNSAIRHFDSLVEITPRRDASRFPLVIQRKRQFTPDEEAFIQNERLLCRLDFRYWCDRYAYIKSWRASEAMINFEMNTAQLVALYVWADLEAQGVSIEILQLKARQLGISTLVELAVQHRAQFYSYINAVVASSSPGQSEKMGDMMVRCLQRQPWFLLPTCTAFREGALIEFGRFNSGISIQHGSQFTGIGRGTTPSMVHLSEVAAFQRPEQIIDAALLRAVHPAPGVFMVFESTAEGRGNWLHFNWLQALEGYPRNEARLFPMFLPWYVGSDKYPSPEWLHKRPVPQSWEPNSLTQLHADSARRYVASDPVLSRHMPPDWKMPLEQMWFYQCEYNEYKAKRELAVFKQEMPATPDEAFQSTGYSAFDAEVITEYQGMTKPPLGIYGLVARPDLIALNLQPYRQEVNPNLPPIEIVPATRQGIEQDIRVKLVPLRITSSLQILNPNNKVFIWEMPDPSASYGAGEDLAEGLGEDRSVIEIIRKGTPDRPIRQVCEFASDEVNAVGATAIAYALGSLYSPRFLTPGIDASSGQNQLRHIIEINTGEPLQLELRKLGWNNFHRWCRYDSRKLTPTNKLGWYTVTWSRWLMLDYLIHFLRNHLIDIGSPWFIDEMQSFQKADADAKLKAEFGAHDDRIMALGIAFFSLHIWDYVFKMGVVGSRESQLDDLYLPVEKSPRSFITPAPLPIYQPPFGAVGRPIGSRPSPLPDLYARYPPESSFPGSYQGYSGVDPPGGFDDEY